MPNSRRNQILSVAVLAVALLWPVAGDHFQAAITPDRHGCPHSSDLPDPYARDEARAAVLCLVNHERARHDLPPLVEDSRLELAAQRHAEDMGRRDFFAHDDPDGRDPDQRIRAVGYDGTTTGENLFWGVRLSATPDSAVRGWMNSPGHRANILRATFTHIGTGIAYDAPDSRSHRAGVYVNTFGG